MKNSLYKKSYKNNISIIIYMNKKVNESELFRCIICIKDYSSKSSLCNHNKKFHINNNPPYPQKTSKISSKNPQNKYNCCFCQKGLSRIDNLKRHENSCKKNKEIKKQIEMQLQLSQKENEILKLKLKIEKSNKMHPKSFKKLNNMLINNALMNSNINSNNINYNILSLGKENIPEVLSLIDKKKIMNAKYLCLEKMVEIAHCGTYNQFKNIIITNLKDNIAYRFDQTKGYFITTTKNDVLNDIIDNRITDIEEIYDELSTTNKINEEIKQIITKFLEKIQNEEKFIDENENIIYDNYKTYKSNKIKILIYNNNQKISQELSQDII
jgi:hypothetical protein